MCVYWFAVEAISRTQQYWSRGHLPSDCYAGQDDWMSSQVAA